MSEKKKAKPGKRDIIELTIIVVVFVAIYFSGYQAEVFGRVQQVFLKTGIMNASTNTEDSPQPADYNFTLIDKDGDYLQASDLKGQTIFMNVWATWCAPCVAEMPGINKLYSNLEDKSNIKFLMISQDASLEKAVKWSDKRGFHFEIYKLASRMPEVYQTGVVPSTFIISPEGNIVLEKTGITNYNTKKFRKFLSGLGEPNLSN